MPDVGDRVTLTLTVDPADETTEATVIVTSPPPLNVPTALVATPGADNEVWTAPLTLTSAGEWRIAWTVSGTGANVEYDTVYAIPQPSGRSYATLTDLAGWLMSEPPAGSARRLIRATEKIDQLLLGARYPVDDDGMPTDTDHITALKDAVCAQVEWWVETGDTTGSGVSTSWDSVQIGSVSLSRKKSGGASNSSPSQSVAPAAVAALHAVNLLPIRAILFG